MPEFYLSVKSNIDQFERDLDEVARTQLPFAASLAINRTAKLVAEAEVKGMTETFDNPTPFTKKGMGVIPAKKDSLEAVVFVKDIQAQYLAPYEFGGKQIPAKPSGEAMLVPKNIPLNQYGNIPYQKVKSLRGRKDVFVGSIILSDGVRIGGVFQRLKQKKNEKGEKEGDRIKILVRFSDPVQVRQHLNYFQRAEKVVDQNFDRLMDEAMDYAMATRR